MTLVLRSALALAAAVFTTSSLAAPALKSDKDKISYMIGHQIGSNLKNDGIEVDLTVMQQAVKDAVAGQKSPIPEAESEKLMKDLQASLQAKAAAKRDADGKKNVDAGKAFLADNAKKPGVKTTASGLQYKVLTEGKGDSPKASDTVSTNYRGTLIDGTEFDSSYKRGQPAKFPVGGVIKGWTEALQMMKPGAKWQLVVPSDLAYGDRGAGGTIGPNSTLIFEVELLGIEKPTAEVAPSAAPSAKP